FCWWMVFLPQLGPVKLRCIGFTDRPRFGPLINVGGMFDTLCRQHANLLRAFSKQLATDVFLHLPQTARYPAKNAGIDPLCRNKEELCSRRLDGPHERRSGRRQL